VRDDLVRLYGWGSLMAGVFLADIAGVLLLQLFVPGWFDLYPAAGIITVVGAVLPSIAVLVLAVGVLFSDRGMSSTARWGWAGAILVSSFVGAAAFFLVWWWSWDEPHPLFRKRA